jgi:hypothetical protein
MAVQERQILLSTERAWKKERVAWSQKWLPYHLPEGYLGVTGVRGQRQNESNQTPGNSPRRWRQARAYIDITHALNSNIQLYLSLAQQFLFDTFLCLKLNPYRTHFFLSFLAVERLNVQIFLFLFTNFIIYIKIWHICAKNCTFQFFQESMSVGLLLIHEPKHDEVIGMSWFCVSKNPKFAVLLLCFEKMWLKLENCGESNQKWSSSHL